MHSLGQVRWLNLSPTATTRRCDDGDTSFLGHQLVQRNPFMFDLDPAAFQTWQRGELPGGAVFMLDIDPWLGLEPEELTLSDSTA
ncbi:hypothetical protein CJ203_06100 [Corynebacterium tuscaniense]|uniref:Uncharacterized protein n=1 Tax=Corynebacterium tuscaniense TaxID=302449 RepID=A0A2N6T4S5_9CORY|nr:hypothetical protein CJ203_06100 [Corynebacterium tuscaniense]